MKVAWTEPLESVSLLRQRRLEPRFFHPRIAGEYRRMALGVLETVRMSPLGKMSHPGQKQIGSTVLVIVLALTW